MLSIELKPSWLLAAFFLFIYLSALACLFLLQLPWTIKLVLSILSISSFGITLRRYALLRSPKSILKITQLADREWRLYNRHGDEIRANLLGSSVKTPYFMLLNFSQLDRFCRYKVIVIPQFNFAHDFRRLQIALFH